VLEQAAVRDPWSEFTVETFNANWWLMMAHDLVAIPFCIWMSDYLIKEIQDPAIRASILDATVPAIAGVGEKEKQKQKMKKASTSSRSPSRDGKKQK